MGVAVYQQPEREAGATPVVGGHGRGTSSEKRPPQPRVPIIGVDSGCIPNTKPGTPVWVIEQIEADLNVAGRELVRRKMRKARGRA